MRKRTHKVLPPIVRTTLIKETAGAFWFRAELRDGRTLTITVPKD